MKIGGASVKKPAEIARWGGLLLSLPEGVKGERDPEADHCVELVGAKEYEAAVEDGPKRDDGEQGSNAGEMGGLRHRNK